MTSHSTKIIDDVKKYYGETLAVSSDLKTNACCSIEATPSYLQPLLADVHPEIQQKFYGCGSPIPHCLTGQTVVDLGCGTGRDCYVMSKLVGENGRVIGIDMTDNQLTIAQKHLDYHMQKYRFSQPNIRFTKGYIEDLTSVDIADHSVDVVTSNCVINLSPDKRKVFSEIYRVLKSGGELYFSDIFSDKRIDDTLTTDSVLVGECLGGALYWEDFRRLLEHIGFYDIRIVSQSPVTLDNDEIRQKIGHINFLSTTLRVFKIALEDRCENYGQTATYLGNLTEDTKQFTLDKNHHFIANQPMAVCGNTADILQHSRYAPLFKMTGDKSTHYGLFHSGNAPIQSTTACC